jgi:8-oxo-dGTP pyrophosphatase MutT (NUDIX family)
MKEGYYWQLLYYTASERVCKKCRATSSGITASNRKTLHIFYKKQYKWYFCVMNLTGEIKSFHDIDQFVHALTERVKLPLPGKKAQLKMASAIRNKEVDFNYDTSTATMSSVLILLYPQLNKINTVFILRQTYEGVHSGQVSFPGGRIEENDKSLIDTALREAQEEVNVRSEKVKVLGSLSELFIPPSNYLVLPVLGYMENRPDLKPDTAEVSEIIEADISFLFDENKMNSKIIEIKGHKIEAPYFDVDGHVVWGATAMILSELKEVILSIL